MPSVEEPVTLTDFLACANADLAFIASPGGESVPIYDALSAIGTRIESICLLVGPEGGFTRREAEAAAKASFTSISLGPNVLRVETAALAVLAAVVCRLDAATAKGDSAV